MILLHRQPFGVSTYHLRHHGGAPRDHQRGLVLPVRVCFEGWLEGRDVDADAFLDPGSDGTILSWRWAALSAYRHRPRARGLGRRESVNRTIGRHSCIRIQD